MNFITGIDLSLVYRDALMIGYSQAYDVIINGVTVGGFTIAGGDDFLYKTATNSFAFAPITGPDDTVLFKLSSAPAGAVGNIGWPWDSVGSGFSINDEAEFASVPEPGTFSLLLGPAFAGLCVLRRKKQPRERERH
ncbi:MAG: PEP-CTERM sorting domain-containing protein [Bryobacterales bacterium]|nr:PEP-CTERM sorting domain-containing protein [Bryobacterales bacterium]